MSKPNDKSTATTAPGAATGASDLAVVQPAPAAAPAKDPNHGRGGLYTVTNGRRERIDGTASTTAQPAAKKESAA